MSRQDKVTTHEIIKNGVIASLKNPGDIITTFKNLKALHPKATKADITDRGFDQALQVDFAQRETGRAIAPVLESDRAASESLKLDSLQLVTTLTTGSWKRELIQKLAPKYPDDGDPEKQLTKIKKRVGTKNFYNHITEFLKDKVRKENNKTKKHEYGRLTSGLELEIKRPHNFIMDQSEEAFLAQNIDLLQHIGIPIWAEAMREVALPKSQSMHEQLKAFLFLIELGLIPDAVNIHLNIGGFTRVDSNTFLLQEMAVSAGLFEKDIKTKDNFHPLDEKNIHWAKHLVENNNTTPKGLPLRVRKNNVVEFRWIGTTRDFVHVAKGLETFLDASEALAAWHLVNDRNPKVTERDLQLAEVWSEMRLQALVQFKKEGFEEDDVYCIYQDAEEYARHESRIRHQVVVTNFMDEELKEKNTKNRQNMYEVFRSGRSKVRRILKSNN